MPINNVRTSFILFKRTSAVLVSIVSLLLKKIIMRGEKAVRQYSAKA